MFVTIMLLPVAAFVAFVIWKFRVDIEDEKAFRSQLSGFSGNLIEPR
jgi:hypothetical protein